MRSRNDIILELMKRLQADNALRVDLSDLIKAWELEDLSDAVGDVE